MTGETRIQLRQEEIKSGIGNRVLILGNFAHHIKGLGPKESHRILQGEEAWEN